MEVKFLRRNTLYRKTSNLDMWSLKIKESYQSFSRVKCQVCKNPRKKYKGLKYGVCKTIENKSWMLLCDVMVGPWKLRELGWMCDIIVLCGENVYFYSSNGLGKENVKKNSWFQMVKLCIRLFYVRYSSQNTDFFSFSFLQESNLDIQSNVISLAVIWKW